MCRRDQRITVYVWADDPGKKMALFQPLYQNVQKRVKNRNA